MCFKGSSSPKEAALTNTAKVTKQVTLCCKERSITMLIKDPTVSHAAQPQHDMPQRTWQGLKHCNVHTWQLGCLLSQWDT
jgi:hypothetical protein